MWGRQRMVVFFLKSWVPIKVTGKSCLFNLTWGCAVPYIYFPNKLICLELLFIRKNPGAQKSTLVERIEIDPQKRVKRWAKRQRCWLWASLHTKCERRMKSRRWQIRARQQRQWTWFLIAPQLTRLPLEKESQTQWYPTKSLILIFLWENCSSEKCYLKCDSFSLLSFFFFI